MNIYKILDIPFFYNLSQRVFAPGKSIFMKSIWAGAFDVKSSPVLDVGCGPKLIGPRPLAVLYGLDINLGYLESYERESQMAGLRDGRQITKVREGVSTNLPFEDNFFQEVRANGFLHHISDEDLIKSAKEMYRCLLPKGQLVILEDVWPKSKFRRPLAAE